MAKVEATRIHTLTGHRDCVYALEGSNDPNLFFSAAGDGLVVLWDQTQPESGQTIAKLPDSIYALHYLSHLDLLVVGHNYDGIHLIDWKEKKELRSLQINTAAIFDIQSFENNLFVASGDGTLSIVDIETWTVRQRIKTSGKSARAITINPVSGELAVGYSDSFIRIFDLYDFRLKQEWQAHENSVFTLAYTRDFKNLLSGSRDARLKSWCSADQYALAGEVVAHLYAINNIKFSPDGKHFVTCSLDKSIKVWDTGDLKLLKVLDKGRHAGHGTSVNKLLWTSFNDQLISASDDRTIGIWRIGF